MKAHLMTKGGRPLGKANADPSRKKCFTLYFYKTFSGRTEIRIFQKRLDSKSGRWKTESNGEILKSASAASGRVRELLESWE